MAWLGGDGKGWGGRRAGLRAARPTVRGAQVGTGWQRRKGPVNGRPRPEGIRPRFRTRLPALLVAVLAPLFPGLAEAQFNGAFTLERHTLEAENFLDWRAYQAPHGWQDEAARAPNVFLGSVGSLSQKRFYVFQELRLEKRLGRLGSVHYYQREESLYRTEPIYREIELRLGRVWSASLVGFPAHEKARGSAGVAVAYGDRTGERYVRLTRLEQYGLYNEEHAGEERFDPTPVMYRLEGRLTLGGALQADLQWRDERPTTLRDPASMVPVEGREQDYAGRKADARVNLRWSDAVSTVLVYRRHREHRAQRPFGAASTVTPSTQEIRYEWWDASAVWRLENGGVLETGVYRGGFHNVILTSGAPDFRHRLLTDAAYAFWHWPWSEWFRWQFSLQGGRAELFTADPAEPAADADARSTEMKAGVGVVLQEAGSYRMFFNTTWDLDVFQHRQWDGGNVQVQWLF